MTTWIDVVRVITVLVFGLGCGLMLATNVIAFQVLRPPKKLGFLWWHVVAISISFLCLGAVAVDKTLSRLHEPPTWRTVATFLGISLFLVAQVIIFGVERSRLTAKKAVEQAGLDPEHAIFDPATQETGVTGEECP